MTGPTDRTGSGPPPYPVRSIRGAFGLDANAPTASVGPVKFYKDEPTTPSKDYSGIGILLSNALVIAYALIEGWDLPLMMVIYWAQSVIIGVFQFFRILLLRSFSTEGFSSNGQRVPENAAGKRSTALFFAVHYGLFHLVYAGFLSFHDALATAGGTFWIIVSVLGFLAGHAFSFYENVRADLGGRPNVGIMMFLPYVRILPMHLVILLGSRVQAGTETLLLFSGLKTLADYVMHIVEHRVLQKKPVKKPKS